MYQPYFSNRFIREGRHTPGAYASTFFFKRVDDTSSNYQPKTEKRKEQLSLGSKINVTQRTLLASKYSKATINRIVFLQRRFLFIDL